VARYTLTMRLVLEEIALNGPTWGYEILKALQAKEKKFVTLIPQLCINPFSVTLGGVYAALDRLAELKLIDRTETIQNGRKIDQCSLSRTGRDFLRANESLTTPAFKPAFT
jgi:DNA-binding PadR family transcriptional regulator